MTCERLRIFFKINLKAAASFALFRRVLSPDQQRKIARPIVERVAILAIDILTVARPVHTGLDVFLSRARKA